MPSEMSYLLFISSPCQNRRMAECSLPESQELCLETTSLPESQNRAIAECLEIKVASPVNQICRFASTKSAGLGSKNRVLYFRASPMKPGYYAQNYARLEVLCLNYARLK